jgi:hypothetical protein
MTAQAEVIGKAFDQAFESFKKTTESTLQLQQDLFRQWTSGWPGLPKLPPTPEKIRSFNKEWAQVSADLTQAFMGAWDQQNKAGLASLEKAFDLAQAKDPTELRQRIKEFWQKSFDCVKEFAQIQTKNFQAAVDKWTELAKKA